MLNPNFSIAKILEKLSVAESGRQAGVLHFQNDAEFWYPKPYLQCVSLLLIDLWEEITKITDCAKMMLPNAYKSTASSVL